MTHRDSGGGVLHSLLVSLLLLALILPLAACGGRTPAAEPAPTASQPEATAVAADGAEAASPAATPLALPSATPRPASTAASTVAAWHWEEGEVSPVPWELTGGEGVVADGRYCLAPSGDELALAQIDSVAAMGSREGVSAILWASAAPAPPAICSAQVLASSPGVEGATVGLAACGVLLEIDGEGRWRQSALTESGAEGAGEWIADPALSAGGAHTLGILCEVGRTYLVGDGAILTLPLEGADPGAPVALAATVPGGGEPVCFDDLRVEAWPKAPEGQTGDDRRVFQVELGLPDAFSLSFEQDPDGARYRVETWTYALTGMWLTFADGVLIETGSLDVTADDLSAWPVEYDPFAFEPDMTLEQVQALLEGQELVSLEVPAEFGEDMLLYGGDQIVLGFTEGELEFVETLPITVDALDEASP